MSDRDWSVLVGYYCECEIYRGPSAFLAGLALARSKGSWGARVWDMNTVDADWSEEFGYEGFDSQTDEEKDFFLACKRIASRRRLEKLRGSTLKARAS